MKNTENVALGLYILLRRDGWSVSYERDCRTHRKDNLILRLSTLHGLASPVNLSLRMLDILKPELNGSAEFNFRVQKAEFALQD